MGEALGWEPSKFKVLGARPGQAPETMCWSPPARFCRPSGEEPKRHESSGFQPKAGKRTGERARQMDQFSANQQRKEGTARQVGGCVGAFNIFVEGRLGFDTTNFSNQHQGQLVAYGQFKILQSVNRTSNNNKR